MLDFLFCCDKLLLGYQQHLSRRTQMSSVKTVQESQPVQEVGPQPFEIWVVGEIQNRARENLDALADQILQTPLLSNHKKIYEEWEWRCGSWWRSDVLEHVYAQQLIADAKAKGKQQKLADENMR